jgi:hypothetical protein
MNRIMDFREYITHIINNELTSIIKYFGDCIGNRFVGEEKYIFDPHYEHDVLKLNFANCNFPETDKIHFYLTQITLDERAFNVLVSRKYKDYNDLFQSCADNGIEIYQSCCGDGICNEYHVLENIICASINFRIMIRRIQLQWKSKQWLNLLDITGDAIIRCK